jgi:dTDP-4-dehydrorhamnose reductase
MDDYYVLYSGDYHMKIVILGGTGMIGHKLWHNLSKRFDDVYTIIHRAKKEFESYGIYNGDKVIDSIDVRDFKLLDGILLGLRPHVIINCIGITKRNPDSNNAISCLILNALLSHMLAEWGKVHGARVIVFGTDCVFNGKEGNYVEESLPSAEDLYGRTKYLGEIRERNCLTLRTSFIGRELTSFTELLEWFLAQDGKTIKGFRKALYTGVSTIYLSRVVGDLIEYHQNLSGLYHLSGEIISKYDLLCLARDAFKVNIEIIPDDSFICSRTLIGERFKKAIGVTVPSWREMMPEIASDNQLYSHRTK